MTTRILFLCTGNRARSQMAEGLARLLARPEVEIASAGTKPNPRGVHPVAIETLRARGADTGPLRPKHVDELHGEFDYVITLCDSAAQECPTFPARRGRLHWGQPDPDAAGDDPLKLRAMFADLATNLETLLRDWLGGQGLLKP
jgi:arsenate reductase